MSVRKVGMFSILRWDSKTQIQQPQSGQTEVWTCYCFVAMLGCLSHVMFAGRLTYFSDSFHYSIYFLSLQQRRWAAVRITDSIAIIVTAIPVVWRWRWFCEFFVPRLMVTRSKRDENKNTKAQSDHYYPEDQFPLFRRTLSKVMNWMRVYYRFYNI